MLVLQRKQGEEVVIGGSIRVRVLAIHGNHVRLGFTAPGELVIFRRDCLTAGRLEEADPPSDASLSASSAHGTQLQAWIDRTRAGDLAAREELLRAVRGSLERLAGKMLKRFPGVRRWVEPDDVLQNALLRLLRALQEVRPESTRAFFGLAAEQIRRELLDLARHFDGPQGLGANHVTPRPGEDGAVSSDPPDKGDEPNDLERWAAFHEEVASLPAEEREVVGLIFYHGWKQAEVAELFQVTVRTVQRRWESAVAELRRRLKEDG